ncbi:hypothetical protein [Chryseobacterium pennipullorum]|nr:hypothetical protein [Chryseobacterium pennipullorum]
METKCTSKFKKLSRKEQLNIIAGDISINNGGNDDGTGAGGTNNGGGSGNVINPCLVKVTKCLSYNRCTQQDVPLC